MSVTISSKSDVRADLEKAFEEHTLEDKNKDVKIDDKEEDIVETNEAEDTEAWEKEEAPEEGAQEPAEKTEPAKSAYSAPKQWDKKDKEMFNGLPDSAKEFVLRRHASMESDYTKKMKEFAPVKNVVDYFSPIIKSYNMQPEQAVGMALNTMNVLKHGTPQQKAKEVMDIISGYGIDLSLLGMSKKDGAEQDDFDVDPNVKKIMEENSKLRDELSGLSSKVMTKEEFERTTRVQNTHNELMQMHTAKDERGQLKYPYMEEVLDQMIELAELKKIQGAEIDLIDLYNTAVRLNPAVFDKSVASQRKALGQSDVNKQKVEKARKAAVSVSGAPAGVQSSSAKGVKYHSNNRRDDIRKDLEAAFREHSGSI